MGRMSDLSILMAECGITDRREQQTILDAYVRSVLGLDKPRRVLRYEGTIRGFRRALGEVRREAMAGHSLNDCATVRKLQIKFRAKQIEDLRQQILGGGNDAA